MKKWSKVVLRKFFEEICLLEQEFVKDPDQKVKQFVESNGATVKSFVRYEVGEGMENVKITSLMKL